MISVRQLIPIISKHQEEEEEVAGVDVFSVIPLIP